MKPLQALIVTESSACIEQPICPAKNLTPVSNSILCIAESVVPPLTISSEFNLETGISIHRAMTSLHPQQRCTAPQKWISPDQFGKDLEKAISGAFPTGRTPYGQVFVLLTSWEYDDETEDIDRDVPELQRVFTSDYNYVCKRYRIPTELQQSTPESALKQEMIDFASMGTSKDLLIFYYAGHSLRVTEPEKSRPFELQYEIPSAKSFRTKSANQDT